MEQLTQTFTFTGTLYIKSFDLSTDRRYINFSILNELNGYYVNLNMYSQTTDNYITINTIVGKSKINITDIESVNTLSSSREKITILDKEYACIYTAINGLYNSNLAQKRVTITGTVEPFIDKDNNLRFRYVPSNIQLAEEVQVDQLQISLPLLYPTDCIEEINPLLDKITAYVGLDCYNKDTNKIDHRIIQLGNLYLSYEGIDNIEVAKPLIRSNYFICDKDNVAVRPFIINIIHGEITEPDTIIEKPISEDIQQLIDMGILDKSQFIEVVKGRTKQVNDLYIKAPIFTEDIKTSALKDINPLLEPQLIIEQPQPQIQEQIQEQPKELNNFEELWTTDFNLLG